MAVYLWLETEMVDFVSFLVRKVLRIRGKSLERRFALFVAHYCFKGFVHISFITLLQNCVNALFLFFFFFYRINRLERDGNRTV